MQVKAEAYKTREDPESPKDARVSIYGRKNIYKYLFTALSADCRGPVVPAATRTDCTT